MPLYDFLIVFLCLPYDSQSNLNWRRTGMSEAIARILAPSLGRPTESEEARLNVVVIFTSVQSTVAALKKAGTLANQLNGRITLVVPQVVPYPLPLNNPPVL